MMIKPMWFLPAFANLHEKQTHLDKSLDRHYPKNVVHLKLAMDANALVSHPPPKNHLIDCIISRRYALIAQATIAQKTLWVHAR